MSHDCLEPAVEDTAVSLAAKAARPSSASLKPRVGQGQKIHKKGTRSKLTRAQRCCTDPQQKVLKLGIEFYPLFTLEVPQEFSPEKGAEFFFLDFDDDVAGGVNPNNGENHKSNEELHLDGKG